MQRNGVKRERRQDLRARRREIAAGRDRVQDARALTGHALTLLDDVCSPRPLDSLTITLYEPLPHEPDVSDLLQTAHRLGVEVLVPITLPDLDLDWAPWSPQGLGPPRGPAGIAHVDLAFVPGLAVDAAGTRLGQGGGCYDRALPRITSTAPVVCVLHPGEDRTEPALPRQDHDVPVDAVLTAEGVRWITRPG
ncbi:MAG: 5-formyltetrahydrofolate cyclo-ligase [Actinomycetia bacterium]|nr:5-formyltetrahydrofolate cyclo-ligase [Actinomycetes bacterium]